MIPSICHNGICLISQFSERYLFIYITVQLVHCSGCSFISNNCPIFDREEWTEAIQAVADRLQRQEEERMNCSPTSQIDNIGEEEMDASTTHHKRKVDRYYSR